VIFTYGYIIHGTDLTCAGWEIPPIGIDVIAVPAVPPGTVPQLGTIIIWQ